MSYDNSQVQSYKDCPYSHALKYAYALRKVTEGSSEHDRAYGSAIHAGLRKIWEKAPLPEAQETFRAAYPVQLDEKDLAKTQANGLILLEEFEAWKKVNYEAYEPVCVEKTLKMELAPGVRFLVKPDGVLKHRSSGEFYGCENKTTKNTPSAHYWNKFDPNSQISAQSAAIEQNFGSCSGVFVNALSFGFRQRAYKGEPAGFHFRIEKQLFNRNPYQLKKWREDALLWISRIEESKRTGAWGKNTAMCAYCSYRPICMAEWTPEEDMELIQEMFEQHDPYAYLEDAK